MAASPRTVAELDLALHVPAGSGIVWGQATGEPTTLVEALIDQRERLAPVSVFLGAAFSDTLRPDAADHIRFSGFGAVGTVRRLSAAGVLEIVPCHVSQVAPMIERGVIPCDVAFVQVSPPGRDGRHSLGVIGDYIGAAIAAAKVVIAEVNDQVPFTYGAGLDPGLIDVALATSRPVVEVPSVPIGETEAAIAEYVAEYVGDGATLQIGVGSLPDAVLQRLTDRRNLGLHSGSIGDSVVDLVERGVITNARKAVDTGVSVTGALIGTRRLYDFADRNAAVGVRPTSFTHDAAVLAALPSLVAINTAVEVDLTGQVNAEQAGPRYIGATGGQADFHRAGARSPGGRAVLALPSTAGAGSVSRIVHRLTGPVTVGRSDADVVVTEWGSAELAGRSLSERARRMIAIAHPDFRERLERAATALLRDRFDR